MTKRKFKCQILTQDIGEWASLFAGRGEEGFINIKKK